MGKAPARVSGKAPAKSRAKAPARVSKAPARRRPAEVEVEVDEYDEVDEVIEGEIVVDPDLVFTTPERDDEDESEADRTVAFEIDGEIYKIIRPRKFPEVMRRLIAATSRRASEADTLWAGEEFLERVLHPDSIRRLNERLGDDDDPFREEDLYDILKKVVEKIGEKEREKTSGKARARARGRR